MIGAGPAGCAAALRLRRLGHHVTLVERGGPGRPAQLESVPATVLAPLHALDLQGLVERAGFARTTGAWVQWAAEARHQAARQPGLLLERARFDALLQQAARAAGVRWMAPARARPPEAQSDGRWAVPLQGGGRRLLADGVVLATGGAPGAAEGPPTAALVGHWVGPALPQAQGESRVQAGPHGWAWAVPEPSGGCAAALFVAAARLGGLRAADREALYREALAGFRLLAPLLQGRLLPGLRTADASPRLGEALATAGLVRVGDAALCLDPLSSQGLVSALRSGLQGAVCLHTMLGRPSDAALAQAFHHDQVQREHDRHRQWLAGFDGLAAQRFATPFWRQRAQAGPAAPPSPAADPALGHHGAAAAESEPATAGPGAAPPLPALDRLLQLDRRIRFHPTPMLEGDWVVAAPALQHPGLAAPVGYVQGQPVAALLAALAPRNSVGRVLQAWAAQLGAQAAIALLQAWWRQGVVVEAQAG